MANTSQPRTRSITRRSVLLAAAPTFLLSTGVLAETPENKLAAQPKELPRQLVTAANSQPIQLRPISRDFDNTIIQAIAADPRGELIAVAGDDHAIRILVAESLKTIATLQQHTDLIRSMHFDRAGNHLVSAGNDGQLIVWDRRSNFETEQRTRGALALACVRFSPDGNELATVGFENEVFLFARGRRSPRPKVQCDCKDLRAVAYRGDGKLLVVGGRSGSLFLFDPASGEQVGDFAVHAGRIHCLQFVDSSPVVVSVGEDGAVTMFDTEAKQITAKIPVTKGKLFSVCILDKQFVAVAGSENEIRIVDVNAGATVEVLRGHTGSIAALAKVGSYLFSGGFDATLRRWQLVGMEAKRDRIAERTKADY